jgi:hypothetical protein
MEIIRYFKNLIFESCFPTISHMSTMNFFHVFRILVFITCLRIILHLNIMKFFENFLIVAFETWFCMISYMIVANFCQNFVFWKCFHVTIYREIQRFIIIFQKRGFKSCFHEILHINTLEFSDILDFHQCRFMISRLIITIFF